MTEMASLYILINIAVLDGDFFPTNTVKRVILFLYVLYVFNPE